MTPLFGLNERDSALLLPLLEEQRWEEEQILFRTGDPPDGCVYLLEGTVRLEVPHPELVADVLWGFAESGKILGEVGLLSGKARIATAIAHTPVRALRLSTRRFSQLFEEHPALAAALVKAMASEMASRLEVSNERWAQTVPPPIEEVEALVGRAARAQASLLSWPEERLDALLGELARTLDGQARALAEQAVAETGLGNVPDKTSKNHLACRQVWDDLKAQQGFGLLPGQGLVREVAAPVGVVVALVPVTNPTAAAIFKILLCLKARSAVILSPHRAGAGCGARVAQITHEVLRAHGAPQELVQVVLGRTGRLFTEQLMRHPGVGLILATGGSGMVRAAYSSGKPTLGVGAGNAPCWVAADADLGQAAADVVRSKSYDNGIICASEHNLVVERAALPAFVEALEAAGAAVLGEAETQRASERWIEGDHLKKGVFGRDAASLAAEVGIHRDAPPKVLVVPAPGEALPTWLGKEKLAPIISLFAAEDAPHALAISQALLAQQGAGHTAAIHTRDPERLAAFARALPAGRLLVNTPTVHGMLGVTTGLPLSFMLGCGTFGGNSTTDHIGLRHLVNVKRLAFDTRPGRALPLP